MTPYPLLPLDIAAGILPGPDPQAEPLPSVASPRPRDPLEKAVARGLRRAPCLVAFSGGRDSSAILALAMEASRRLGLPQPIPATLRFPGVAEAEETKWQEGVVRHLEVDDWIRIELTSELDLVGPIAQGVLRRRGLLFPANAHILVPLAQEARGGSLLTGLDGDGLLEGWRWQRGFAVLRGRVPPRPRHLAILGLALAPRSVKRAVLRQRLPSRLPWLRPAPAETVRDAAISDQVGEPVNWSARVRRWAHTRYLRALLVNANLLCSHYEVQAVHPFADPAVLASVARAGGKWGFGDRTAAMRALVGDLLLDEIVQRPVKATFDDVYWNAHARAFIETWDGTGVDPDLVDSEALRKVWVSPKPDFRSSLLLQQALLAADSFS